MKLYEIDNRIDFILSTMVDPETGEIAESTDAELENLMLAREEKLENTALFVKNQEVMIDAIAAEIQTLQKRKAQLMRSNEWLKNYLDYSLQGAKFATPKCEIRTTNTKACVIDNEDAVLKWIGEDEERQQFLKVETSIRKAEIKKLIESGEEVPGAYIKPKRSVSIR